MREYKTIQGDTWDIIAKNELGSELFISQLIQANHHLAHFVICPAGVSISIPDLPLDTLSTLPPWKV